MKQHVEILPDKGALVDRALALVVEKLRGAIAARDRATIALSGGSTPKPLYEALAAAHLPPEKLYIFWGDERYVSPESPESNYRMAREAWLDPAGIPKENVYAMPTDGGDPQADANRYEASLKHFFGLKEREFPQLDVILLGMGDDGHTASLFPHTAALQVCDRAVTVGNKDGQPRLTLTLPTLNLGECVIFLVAGANKQNPLSHVFSEDCDTETYPAGLIQPIEGELWWLLDAAAGAAVPG